MRCYTAVFTAAAAAAAAAALLPAAVRRRVPDGQIAGSLNLIPVLSFSSFKRDSVLMVPLGSTAFVAYSASICLRTLSVITGKRGAKAGVSPARRSPLVYY